MTFVDIATVLTILRQYVTICTLANKATNSVDASAVVAYVWIALTFVDIDTIVSVTSQ